MHHACQVNRAVAVSKGVNIKFSNWGIVHKFLHLLVYGYPLNRRIGIKHEEKLAGADHADAKIVDIKNPLIQSGRVAQLKCKQIIDFWGTDNPPITRKITFNPAIRPGSVIILTSDLEGIDARLYYVHDINGLLSDTAGLSMSLKNMIRI
jgi:hypothetical protein